MQNDSTIIVPLKNENDQDEENIMELEEDWGDEFNNVVAILCGLHLNQYVDTFVNQGITEDIFFNLNEDDLCHIGVTSSKDREALLQGVSKLTRTRTKMSSQICLSNLSPEETSAILANTVKHLTVIHASLAHLRLTLHNPSVHNSLINLKLSSAQLLHLMTSKATIQARLLSDNFSGFLSNKPGLQKKAKKKWILPVTLLSSVGVLCAILFSVHQKVMQSQKSFGVSLKKYKKILIISM